MMNNKILILFSLLFLGSVAHAQNERYPIFTYGEDTVFNDEFMRVFMKNKPEDYKPTAVELDEYLELYIKFKLKVEEAYNLEMDTIAEFQKELAGYRAQAAIPYLSDNEVKEKLIREGYERMKYEVNASHLLILCPYDASPKDSFNAYQRAINLRNRIVKGGQDFGELAAQFSEDPSAKTNQGNLGYFSAFDMIYKFENAVYSMDVGSVSMPIRTKYGYHLIRLNEKRETIGKIQVAQIMINFTNEQDVNDAQRRIEAVHAKLEEGANWEDMVKEFSEDFRSAANGGKLNYFSRTSNNVPLEFKEIAFDLTENGQYSKPFKTKHAWHIIRRVDLVPMKSYEQLKSTIKRKVERDSRSELNEIVVLERIKKENNFELNEEITDLASYFDESVLEASYAVSDEIHNNGEKIILFTLGDETYNLLDFAAFVSQNKEKSRRSLEYTIDQLFQNFIKLVNFDYENRHLEEKYPSFEKMMLEFKEGILLFELTEIEVWNKAIQDSVGLETFYQANLNNYMLNERAEVSFLSFKDKKTAKKAMKLMKKMSVSEMAKVMNENDPLAVSVKKKTLDKGTEVLADVEWAEGVYAVGEENGRIQYIKIHQVLMPSPKPLQSNLGQVTADYQNQLERDWIAALKTKYPVVVYEENYKRLNQ